MGVVNSNNATLLDMAKLKDPNGVTANIVEMLSKENAIIQDMPFIEGNLPTGHQTTIRSGLPEPTWRRLYGGVKQSKSRAVKVTDTCGMLEAYSSIDSKLLELNGNSPEWRLSEERAFIESIGQEFARTLFYGNEKDTPETFTGLAPRFCDAKANNGDNILCSDQNKTKATNTSIWLVAWDESTAHGIFPKGTKAGITQEDRGFQDVEADDGSGKYKAAVTHYGWDCGLSVRDWRYVVRIIVDTAALKYDAATGANLPILMAQASERIQSLSKGRAAYYCNRQIRELLRLQTMHAIKQSTLTWENVGGQPVLAYGGIPVRRCDSISNIEKHVNS